MFLEDDDIFGGSPRKKFYDIVYNANRNLVENEIDAILVRTNAMEALLEERLQDGEDIEKLIVAHNYSDLTAVENHKINSYIVHTGNILSQNE
jgi:hypothetical protein